MNNNLELLREYMRSKGVDAVIIPGTDPHQSEYVSDYWKFRDWVSGFTGSNGTAVVTLNSASLWTDSRYFLQAAIELKDSGFELQGVEYRGELNGGIINGRYFSSHYTKVPGCKEKSRHKDP